jgi:hypothetical protein
MADVDAVDVSAELAALVCAFPLPAGVPDEKMNVAEIALAMRVSANTVAKWTATSVLASDWTALPQFPVIEVGGPGRAYSIQLSHAWAWRQHRDGIETERSKSAARAIEAMQASFLNLDPRDAEGGMTAKLRRELAEADFAYSKAATMRRRLVDIDEVQQVLESVFQIMRDGMESMPDRLERELGLKPDQVDLIVRLADDILREMADRIEDAELRERDLSDDEIPDRVLI